MVFARATPICRSIFPRPGHRHATTPRHAGAALLPAKRRAAPAGNAFMMSPTTAKDEKKIENMHDNNTNDVQHQQAENTAMPRLVR